MAKYVPVSSVDIPSSVLPLVVLMLSHNYQLKLNSCKSKGKKLNTSTFNRWYINFYVKTAAQFNVLKSHVTAFSGNYLIDDANVPSSSQKRRAQYGLGVYSYPRVPSLKYEYVISIHLKPNLSVTLPSTFVPPPYNPNFIILGPPVNISFQSQQQSQNPN